MLELLCIIVIAFWLEFSASLFLRPFYSFWTNWCDRKRPGYNYTVSRGDMLFHPTPSPNPVGNRIIFCVLDKAVARIFPTSYFPGGIFAFWSFEGACSGWYIYTQPILNQSSDLAYSL